MVATVLRDEDRSALARRIGAVSTSSVAAWGRLDVAAMLAHLCRSARMALGELPVASLNKRAFRRFPLKPLVLYVLPFPKGAHTAPELLGPPAGSLESSQSELLDLLSRFGKGPHEGVGPAHPLFGVLSRREWGILLHKHMDHHLRQFGV